MIEEVVTNELRHDGMRRVKVIADAVIDSGRFRELIPLEGRERAQLVPGDDEGLGIFSLEILWPVYGPVEFAVLGPLKFRRLMVVNFCYAARVSEAIHLAAAEYFARTHFIARDAFVRDLPQGAEVGMLVHGVILQAAEWMPAHCVAVGGRND